MYTLVDGVTYLVTGGDADARGLYHGDTRHLSPLSVAVDGPDLALVHETRRPPFRRTRRFANVGTAVNEISDTVESKHATTVFERRQTVSEGRFVERLDLHNYGTGEQTVDLVVSFDADFADIFEVRKLRTAPRRDVAAGVDGRTVTYAYEYADRDGQQTTLETAVTFDPVPATLEPGRARFALSPEVGERRSVTVEVAPGGDESTVRAAAEAAPANGVDERVDPFVVDGPIEAGDAAVDRAFAASRRDVRALTTVTDHGPVALAGAPWFVTVFGRDALLASYLLLPVAPSLARGTLRYLAAHQGTDRNDRRDEAPGTILHEIRRGELARNGAIPQVPYYGSVDATPLWVTLLHETWRWTGDDDLVGDLWGYLEAALDWLGRAVAETGDDEFLYYDDLGRGGVSHKVWRDSSNGLQYADGRTASPPLASAAVQGYLYDALDRAADLASAVRGDDELAEDLRSRAGAVAAAFDDAFWMPERDYYAAALTPDGRQVDSVTSTVGHCLWSGIVPAAHADDVVDRLMAPDVRSRWGLRTLSADDDGYSPISYHAGGIWPHDNALAALGLARYGHTDAVTAIVESQLDALTRFDGDGAPELFCGFDDPTAPVPYPSGCRPQAWAAAAPYGFLRALFDLDPDEHGVGDPDRASGPIPVDAVEPVTDYWR